MSKRPDAIGFFWQDIAVVKPPKAEKPKRTPPERTWERPDYLPGLEEALAFRIEQFEDSDLVVAQMKRERLVFDIECYVNYFLIAFTSLVTGKVIYFERTADHDFNADKLRWIMDSFCVVSFNGIEYDLCILALALAGKSTAQMKEASDMIILEGLRPSDVLRRYKVKAIKPNHIDLIEVAPLRASLKLYAGRLHAPRMQDLPFHPDIALSHPQIAITRWYCVNDLSNTALLYEKLKKQIELRETLSEEYGIDLRSKSDAQIAEAVITKEVEKLNGHKVQRPVIEPGTQYRYQVPAFIRYQTPLMNWALNVVRNAPLIVSENGSVDLPAELKELKLHIAGAVYRMGVGGLHSSEQCSTHTADAETFLVDRDMTSYYPNIILLLGLYPKHLTQNFLRVYKLLVDRRIAAKRANNKVVADSLKITINGSFGKLGSKYSALYAPDLLIQVTITGQLSLLMLIERLELNGIRVVSANTDGIAIKCARARREEMNAIIAQWEKETGFNTEETEYKGLYSRDVNNYIAVKLNGEVKTKGAYADATLSKNPVNQICVDAVLGLLTTGTPISQTVRSCKDIRKFVSVRTVKGGAVKVLEKTHPPPHGSKEELLRMAGFYEIAKGAWLLPEESDRSARSEEDAYKLACDMLSNYKCTEYLGKSIRWYYKQGDEGIIVYAGTGNKVPRSEGAQPLMDLPDQFPEDVNYEWYENEAERMLLDIGYSS